MFPQVRGSRGLTTEWPKAAAASHRSHSSCEMALTYLHGLEHCLHTLFASFKVIEVVHNLPGFGSILEVH